MSKVFFPFSNNPGQKKSLVLETPLLKRNLSILGTSGLVLGLGLTGSTQALATPGCDGNNTIQAVENPTDNFNNINEMVNTIGNTPGKNIVCLDGVFEINQVITVEALTEAGEARSVTFSGIGESSSVESTVGVFHSELNDENEPLHDITVNNLTVQNSDNARAVGANNVNIYDSTFIGNAYGAVFAQGDVEIRGSIFVENQSNAFPSDSVFLQSLDGGAVFAHGSVLAQGSMFDSNATQGNGLGGAIFALGGVEAHESTFVDNRSQGMETNGGAIASPRSVLAEHSTFVGNTAEGDGYGGAIYSDADVASVNSTFVDNWAAGDAAEGGAIFSEGGMVWFSTFVDNSAAEPGEGDIPGEAIYKGAEYFEVYGSIFVSSGSNFPQLGVGVPPGEEVLYPAFTDLGGNVFSTSESDELDLMPGADSSSVFNATLTQLFGSEDPALGIHEPNQFGTESIALVAGSPAINIVPVIEGDRPITDQRGATRSGLFDAGAYEFTGSAPAAASPKALAKTGSDSAGWSIFAVTSTVIGALVLAVSAMLRRRSQ